MKETSVTRWGRALFAVTVASCSTTTIGGLRHLPSPEQLPSSVAPAERQAYSRARPVFERYCAGCHTPGGGNSEAVEHFNIGTYPFTGHHSHEVAETVRRALGATGKPATMPADRPGIVKGEELTRVLQWADAFDGAHPESAAEHHEHHH